MKIAVRAFLSAISAVATLYFVYWGPFSLISLIPLKWIQWIQFLASLVCGAAVGRYVWRHTSSSPKSPFDSVALGAITVSGMCFITGFFGPIIFAPEDNQGPLLGLFITGPLGVLVGALGGCLFWSWSIRGRRSQDALKKGIVVLQEDKADEA